MIRTMIVFLFLASAISANATDFYVNPDGVGGTHATIADAVAAAVNGDRVILMDGVFSGLGNRDVTVFRDIEIRGNNGAGAVTIDCGGSAAEPHRAFVFEYCAAVLSDVTITGGYSVSGGAVTVEEGTATISDCIFRSNTASTNGGALDVFEEAALSLDGVVFDSNRADLRGGAIFASASSNLQIDSCTFVLNGAPEGAHLFFIEGAGGAIDRSLLVWGHEGEAAGEFYGGAVTVTCSDVFGNRDGDWTNALAGQFVGDNMNVDPLLCDPMGAAYGPIASSPVWTLSPCGWMGAIPADLGWDDPVYGLRDNGRGMYETIQEAMDSIPVGGVIALEDGTYSGDGNRNLNPNGKALTLRSRSDDPDSCILNASSSMGLDRVLVLDNGEGTDTVFEGLGFRSGIIYTMLIRGPVGAVFQGCVFGPETGGVSVDIDGVGSMCTASFVDCVFNCNLNSSEWVADLDGCTHNRRIELVNCDGGTIRDGLIEGAHHNLIARGGGLYIRDGGPSELLVVGTNFVDCSVVADDGYGYSEGGGVWMTEPSSIRFASCDFMGCKADSLGADIYAFASEPGHSLTLEACTFDGSTSGQAKNGGSIYIDGLTVDASECIWQDYDTASYGGALYIVYSDINLTECQIKNCSSDLGGGGVFFHSTVVMTDCSWRDNTGQVGDGAFRTNYSDVSMSYCEVTGNSSYYTSAFGIAYDRTGATHVLDHVVVADNQSVVGNAGISLIGAHTRLDQCTFHSNDSNMPEDPQAQVMVGTTARVDLYHTLVTGSRTVAGVGFHENEGQIGTVTAYCSNIYGNIGGDWIGPLADLLPDDENISVWPAYCDPINSVLSLSDASPCLPEYNACSTQIGAKGLGCSGTSPVAENLIAAMPTLGRARPNPFNPSTTISFELPNEMAVSLRIYDVAGRLVDVLMNDEMANQGRNEVVWRGRDMDGRIAPAGIYFYRLDAGNYSGSKRMTLIK